MIKIVIVISAFVPALVGAESRAVDLPRTDVTKTALFIFSPTVINMTMVGPYRNFGMPSFGTEFVHII